MRENFTSHECCIKSIKKKPQTDKWDWSHCSCVWWQNAEGLSQAVLWLCLWSCGPSGRSAGRAGSCGQVGARAGGAELRGGRGLINDQFHQAATSYWFRDRQWEAFLGGEGGSRGTMEGNSTAGSFTPLQQFSVADLVVIVTYFSLNLAVGIWVRVFSLFSFCFPLPSFKIYFFFFSPIEVYICCVILHTVLSLFCCVHPLLLSSLMEGLLLPQNEVGWTWHKLLPHPAAFEQLCPSLWQAVKTNALLTTSSSRQPAIWLKGSPKPRILPCRKILAEAVPYEPACLPGMEAASSALPLPALGCPFTARGSGDLGCSCCFV